MSLSTEAISLLSQSSLPLYWKRNPEPWQHEGHNKLREWEHYAQAEELPNYADYVARIVAALDASWVGGQFFYPHALVAIMTDEHRQWAEHLALSVRGGDRAIWIEHFSCWEVRAVR